MLDDLHELRAPACHDVLGVVISGIPEGSQLVAASRFEQPHLPRLRASGDALELASRDLALDAAGAEQIFAQAHVGVSHEVAAAVTERTEGWPVGLHLAAVIARNRRGEQPVVSGDDRYVADYLYRESLMQLPEKSQRFLRRTAVLDQLSAPLCDALLGESGGQERLRSLEASNLFLVPLDRRREWYRYHALFREFLLGELRRVEPDVIVKLHLRAADWYEANGSPAMALEHLLNTTERDRCVQLVTELVLPTYSRPDVDRAAVALRARRLRHRGVPTARRAGRLGDRADRADRGGATVGGDRRRRVVRPGPVDGSASFDSARAMLRAVMCAAGPEQMMTDADFAVAEEPPWSPWRDTALLLSAEAHLLAGDDDQARVLFAEASAVGAFLGNTDTVVDGESELALLAMDQGRWAEAAEHVEHALAVIDGHRMHDYAVSVLAFAAAARLAVHRGDLDETDRQLTRAMRARPSCTFVLPFLAVRARLQLAKVYSCEATRRPLVTCCARSTTSCSTGRRSACSSTRCRSFTAWWQGSPSSARPAGHR